MLLVAAFFFVLVHIAGRRWEAEGRIGRVQERTPS